MGGGYLSDAAFLSGTASAGGGAFPSARCQPRGVPPLRENLTACSNGGRNENKTHFQNEKERREIMSRKVRATYSPFAAGQMREMLIAYFENHPEILDRPTNYPEGRDQLLKGVRANGKQNAESTESVSGNVV